MQNTNRKYWIIGGIIALIAIIWYLATKNGAKCTLPDGSTGAKYKSNCTNISDYNTLTMKDGTPCNYTVGTNQAQGIWQNKKCVLSQTSDSGIQFNPNL